MIHDYTHRSEQGYLREYCDGSTMKIKLQTDDGLKEYRTGEPHRKASIRASNPKVDKEAVIVVATSKNTGKDYLFSVETSK